LAGAIKKLERTLALRPGDRDTSLYLVELYAKTGGTSALDALLGQMAKDFADTSTIWLARGIADLFAQKRKEAERAFRRAQSQGSKEDLPAIEMANLEYWIGRAVHNEDAKKARPFFERALALSPQHTAAHYYVGHTYYDAGDYAPAAESYEIVLQLDPIGFPKAYFFLGTCLVDTSKKKEAKGALEEFLRRAPKDVDAPEAKRILESLKKTK